MLEGTIRTIARISVFYAAKLGLASWKYERQTILPTISRALPTGA